MAQYSRRLAQKGAAGDGKRGVELVRLASTDDNMFVENTCAIPNYGYTRTALSAVDSTIPTDAPLWDLHGFMGLSGHVEFTGAGTSESVTVQLWGRDDQNNKDFLIAEVASLGHQDVFYFENKVRHHRCYLAVSALTLGGYTNINLYATGV